jgi:hypothetical protein
VSPLSNNTDDPYCNVILFARGLCIALVNTGGDMVIIDGFVNAEVIVFDKLVDTCSLELLTNTRTRTLDNFEAPVGNAVLLMVRLALLVSVIAAKLLQPLNAFASMLIVLLGIVTDNKLSQFENLALLIDVSVDGIFTKRI